MHVLCFDANKNLNGGETHIGIQAYNYAHTHIPGNIIINRHCKYYSNLISRTRNIESSSSPCTLTTQGDSCVRYILAGKSLTSRK